MHYNLLLINTNLLNALPFKQNYILLKISVRKIEAVLDLGFVRPSAQSAYSKFKIVSVTTLKSLQKRLYVLILHVD